MYVIEELFLSPRTFRSLRVRQALSFCRGKDTQSREPKVPDGNGSYGWAAPAEDNETMLLPT